MLPKRLLFVSLALLLLCSVASWAGETGKVSGMVTDEKGEPLYGANVTILNTSKGAMTDANGYFTIFIEAGIYDVKASFIGYSPVTQQGVQVKTDLTSNVDFQLQEGAMDLGITINVSAKAAMIEKDQTTTGSHHSGEDIGKQAAADFTDVLEKETGFVRSSDGGLHVQGGRDGEILYTVDGMPVKDMVVGNDIGIQISNNAISEMMVATGGFDAEYGDAQSAVVNIVTRSGSDRYSGSLEFRTDDFGDPNASYSRNADVLSFNFGGPEPITSTILPSLGLDLPRLFDPEGNITFFMSGEGQFSDTSFRLENHEYPSRKIFGIDFSDRRFNSYSGNIKLAYEMTPAHKLNFSYRYSRQKRDAFSSAFRYVEGFTKRGDGVDGNAAGLHGGVGGVLAVYDGDWGLDDDLNGNGEPDVDWDGPELDANGDGDPTYDPEPSIDEELPNGIDDDGDWIPFTDWDGDGVLDYEDYNENGVFDYGIDRPIEPLNSDLNGNGKQDYDWDGHGEAYDDPSLFDANGDQDPFWDPEAGIDEDLNSYYPFDPFTGDMFNPTDHVTHSDQKGSQIVLEWSHSLSASTFYTFRASQFKRDVAADVLSKEPWQYVWYFPTVAGYKSYGDNLFWQRRGLTQYTGKFDLTSQVVPKYHQMKTGIDVSYYNLYDNQIQYPFRYNSNNRDDGGPYQYRGIYRYFWRVYPWTAAAYIQDKMEFEGLIVKVGLRYDFWDVGEQAARTTTSKSINGVWKTVLAMDENLDGEVTFAERIHDQLSPRLAISHPITDRDVLYFNYGHFSQRPQLNYVYTSSESVGSIPLRGNPNLKPEKTVKYQLGVSHQFSDNLSMTLAGFFRDITDLVDTRQVVIVPFTYTEYQNRDYGSSKGFEVSFRKRYSNYTSGSFNYTISWANGNSSDPRQGYDNREGSKELPLRENPLDWDERHVMSATLDFRVRKNENPELFGVTLPDRWGVNLGWQYGSGKPFSPDAELSGSSLAEIDNNSMRMPWTMNTDLRFNKDFTYSGIDYSAFLWVENLFNRRNVQDVFSSSGLPELNEHPGEDREYNFYEGNGTILPEGQYYEYPYIVGGSAAYGPRRRIMAGLQVTW